MPEEPKVEIGLREIYDALLDLKSIVTNHPAKLEDHEVRIRSLEYKVWTFSAGASVVSVAISQLVTAMIK